MLHCAASQGRLALVEWFLENVFKGNASCKNDLGETPLHLAAAFYTKGKYSNYVILETSKMFDCNSYIYFNLVLNFAHTENNGNQDVVERILEAGADLNARTEWGDTPFHYAALHGGYEVLRFLCEEGAEIDKPIECKCYMTCNRNAYTNIRAE